MFPLSKKKKTCPCLLGSVLSELAPHCKATLQGSITLSLLVVLLSCCQCPALKCCNLKLQILLLVAIHGIFYKPQVNSPGGGSWYNIRDMEGGFLDFLKPSEVTLCSKMSNENLRLDFLIYPGLYNNYLSIQDIKHDKL